MICVACGQPAGYNRAVVDLVSGTEIGGLCVNCERDEFGQALGRGDWSSDDSCALCRRDGHYGLPEWRAELNDLGSISVSSNDYEVSDRTVRLCDEHYHVVAEEDGARAAASTVGEGQSVR